MKISDTVSQSFTVYLSQTGESDAGADFGCTNKDKSEVSSVYFTLALQIALVVALVVSPAVVALGAAEEQLHRLGSDQHGLEKAGLCVKALKSAIRYIENLTL